MATVLELVVAGKLFKLDPQLEYGEREWRWIYGFPPFKDRIGQELAQWTSEWEVEQSPTEQLDALIDVFCSGEALAFGEQFHSLIPVKDGVWELKTPDIRIFGWFCKKNHFIATNIDHAFKVKTYDLYRGYVGEAARLRDQLDLDEPKFVPGEDPNNVVSGIA